MRHSIQWGLKFICFIISLLLVMQIFNNSVQSQGELNQSNLFNNKIYQAKELNESATFYVKSPPLKNTDINNSGFNSFVSRNPKYQIGSAVNYNRTNYLNIAFYRADSNNLSAISSKNGSRTYFFAVAEKQFDAYFVGSKKNNSTNSDKQITTYKLISTETNNPESLTVSINIDYSIETQSAYPLILDLRG